MSLDPVKKIASEAMVEISRLGAKIDSRLFAVTLATASGMIFRKMIAAGIISEAEVRRLVAFIYSDVSEPLDFVPEVQYINLPDANIVAGSETKQ